MLVILGECVPTAIGFFTSTASSQTKLVVVNHADTVAGMNDDALSRYIDGVLNGIAPGVPGSNTPGKPAYTISVAPAGSSVCSLEQQVKVGIISILLVLDQEPNGDLGFTYNTNTGNSGLSGDPHLSGVQALGGQLNVLDRASRLGLTPAQTASLLRRRRSMR